MSILIKNMEMPRSCDDCFLPLRYCPYAMKSDGECPLVPVPPHGRLIDADVTLRSEQPSNCSDELWAGTTLARCINNAPTIIEAEGE